MFSLKVDEDNIIWLALMGSLFIHVFLLIFSCLTHIQHAAYSVQDLDIQSSAQMVEISIREIKSPQELEDKDSTVKVSDNVNEVKKANQVSYPHSGARADANPGYFQNPPPQYPPLARQMRQEGLVMLSVDVDKEGLPVTVEIAISSGYRLLDQAALRAVEHWRFQPGRIGELPVESKVTVPIRFRLEE